MTYGLIVLVMQLVEYKLNLWLSILEHSGKKQQQEKRSLLQVVLLQHQVYILSTPLLHQAHLHQAKVVLLNTL